MMIPDDHDEDNHTIDDDDTIDHHEDDDEDQTWYSATTILPLLSTNSGAPWIATPGFYVKLWMCPNLVLCLVLKIATKAKHKW